MDNIKKFWLNRTTKEKFLWSDLTEDNFKIIEPFLKPSLRVLDLGAGNCELSYKISAHVQHVDAVDFVIPKDIKSNLRIDFYNSDITSFESCGSYDIIIMFGVMNFLYEQRFRIYEKLNDFLKNDGIVIFKHQCGNDHDVFVNTIIDNADYEAVYQSYHGQLSEISLFFEIIESGKAYDHKNIHANTDFYKIIGKKK